MAVCISLPVPHNAPATHPGKLGAYGHSEFAIGESEGSASGLVHLETSGKFDPQCPEFQRRRRLKRMRRAVVTSARLHQEQLASGGFRWKPAMLTLTYRPGVVWRARHVSDLLAHVRKYLARKHKCPLYHVWVSELQLRGAVHYHVMVWLPKGVCLPKPDKQGWWPHGSTRIEWARRAAGYMAKYCSKGSPRNELPKGLRLHGRGGLTAPQRRIVRYWCLPKYVRDFYAPDSDVIRCPGGGFVDRNTGEWLAPYALPPPDQAARRWSALTYGRLA